MKSTCVSLLTMLAIFCGSTSNETPQTKPAVAAEQNIIVHLSEYDGDLHATYMAIEVADRLQARGANVTLLLDLWGARFADGRAPQATLRGPGSRTLPSIYDSFVQRGGHVVVCHHCAGDRRLDKNQLRTGCKMVTLDEIAQVILAADKILEY